MKTHSRSRRASMAAFTLIEMVLVLAIIALLMGVSINLLSGVRDEGKRVRVNADILGITSALQIYESQNLRLPTTEQGLQALVTKPSTAPVPKQWNQQMRALPVDPWTNPYQYRVPAQKNTSGDYDLFSMGGDGKADTDDDIGNWTDTGS